MTDPVEVWGNRLKLAAAVGLWIVLFGLLANSTALAGVGGFVLAALGVVVACGILYGFFFFFAG